MSRLRVAVVGVGHLGKEHARILADLPDVELVGVADVNAEQSQTVARRLLSLDLNIDVEALRHLLRKDRSHLRQSRKDVLDLCGELLNAIDIRPLHLHAQRCLDAG